MSSARIFPRARAAKTRSSYPPSLLRGFSTPGPMRIRAESGGEKAGDVGDDGIEVLIDGSSRESAQPPADIEKKVLTG